MQLHVQTCLLIFAEDAQKDARVARVALKLMAHEDQWLREVSMRNIDDGSTKLKGVFGSADGKEGKLARILVGFVA